MTPKEELHAEIASLRSLVRELQDLTIDQAIEITNLKRALAEIESASRKLSAKELGMIARHAL